MVIKNLRNFPTSICCPKAFGGLGINKIGEFDYAMLSKATWDMIQN